MHKQVKITLLSIILSCSGAAVATTVAPTNIKIMVVELPQVMGSEASSASEKRVKKAQSEQEAKIKKMDDDLDKQVKALQAKAKVAGLDALEKDQEKLSDSKNRRDLAAKSAGEKVQRAANSEMKKLSGIAQKAAEKVLKKLGLDLIITETGAVMAHSAKVDATQDLIKEMISLQSSSTKQASLPSVDSKKTTTSSKKSAKKK